MELLISHKRKTEIKNFGQATMINLIKKFEKTNSKLELAK